MRPCRVLFLSFVFSIVFQSTETIAENDAVSKLRAEPYISIRYRRGNFLIYDCRKRHYLCVNKQGFAKCKKERSDSLDRKRNNLRCTPLKSYETQKDCFAASYKQIHSIKNKSFCVNQRAVGF